MALLLRISMAVTQYLTRTARGVYFGLMVSETGPGGRLVLWAQVEAEPRGRSTWRLASREGGARGTRSSTPGCSHLPSHAPPACSSPSHHSPSKCRDH